ncbi:(R)-mandelonitrile lyase [Pseudomonas sp. CFBP 13719]|uniref:(R)-mandelonitrile lyase n=1 Tax=Pseudomonas sp. CFBP 13719 TaxID=2775303 RepID=UPI00406C36F9
MKSLAAAALSLSLLTFESEGAQPMKGTQSLNVTVTPAGSQPSAVGPAEYFTGKVRVDAPFKGTDGARIGGATVTFEPGARTAWHTHPLGQTLIVTAGAGYVQQEGQGRQLIRPGDTVWIPPQVKHWHGARPDTGMSHIAIAEALEGKVVDWLEQVSDAEYGEAQ